MKRSTLALSVISVVALAIAIGAIVGQPHAAPAPMLSSESDDVAYERDSGAAGEVAPDRLAEFGDDQLIISTGTLSVEVDDLAGAVAEANGLISGLGGRVSASYWSDEEGLIIYDGIQPTTRDMLYQKGNSSPTAVLTYRVPAAQFEAAREAISRLGRILSYNTSSNEVTAEVRDYESRLRNLGATEEALLAIMARATEIKDVLAVQQQLTEVRGQIEQLTAEVKSLREQADQSTLSVTFSLPYVAVTAQSQGWQLEEQIDAATAALIGLGQLALSGLVWLVIVGLPLLLVTLLAGLPLLVIRRRSTKKAE